MFRWRWILVSLAAVAGVLLPVGGSGPAAKQPTANRLVAIQWGSPLSCEAMFAVDAGGVFYADCGLTGHFTPAGRVSGVPVDMTIKNTRDIWIGLENGDIYATNVQDPPPYTFRLVGNAFGP